MAINFDRFHWIRPVHRRGVSYPAPDTDAELDAAEMLLGAPLPASYRAFARQFGLGGRLHRLPELFRLMPPALKEYPHWSDSAIDATRFWRSPDVVGLGRELSADFLRHAIVFGCDEGALTFLFHTGEFTDASASEYRVYQIPRHEGPEPICESFEDWLSWIHKGYCPAALGEAEEDEEDESGQSPNSTMPYAPFPA